MSSDAVAKTVGRKLRYYFEVKRLEDGFDLSGVNAPQLNHPPLKSLNSVNSGFERLPHLPTKLTFKRPTLQYDGLHDRALKHYFSQSDVKTRLTQLMPLLPNWKELETIQARIITLLCTNEKLQKEEDPHEDDVKRLLKRYMYKYRFIPENADSQENTDKQFQFLMPPKIVGFNLKHKPDSNHGNRRMAWQTMSAPNKNKHPTMPQWMYKHHPTKGNVIRPEFVGFGVGLKKSSKKKNLRGGYPLMRTVPSQNVSKTEAHRLIDVATKILVATEKVNELQSRPASSTSRQTAPQPFETDRPLPSTGELKKKRPSTAKYSWDIHGRRHVRVRESGSRSEEQERPSSSDSRRAMDDNFIPGWLLEQSEPRPKSPEPKKSPRPKSAKYRQRDPVPPPKPKATVINVPERDIAKEDVTVNEGTQTAEETVGIQTERRLLEEYDQTEDIVSEGIWGEYQVYVQTGDRVGAATRADVRITLYGEKGRTKEMLLEKSSRNKVKFQSGKEDVFLLPAHHVGKLRKIKIGHDRTELSYAWFLDSVSVYDMNDKRIYDFQCNNWLSGAQGDGKTYREYTVDSERAFVEAYDDVRERHAPLAGKARRKKDETSTDSRASKDDKRSLESLRGSRGGHHSDSDSSTTSYSSSTVSSNSSGRRRRKNSGRKSASPTPRTPRELSPPREAPKDDFFDKKSGPTFTFRRYSNSGDVADEEYLDGYKAGLEASANDQKQQQEMEEEKRTKLLQGPSIFDAARAGDLERMQELIDSFPDMKDSKDETGLTALHIATQQGRLDIVKWLTACSINLNTETSTGYTAIHLAAMNGHLNCMIVLAAMGATLTCRSVDKQTPLHVAAMNGHLECVKWLIANRASLQAVDQLKRTPLELADLYQHTATADFIRKCQNESDDPSSSLHALRSSSRKELGTIREDRRQESSNDHMWHDDIKPESARANYGSESEGRNAKYRQNHVVLQEKRRVYEEQHNRMEQTGTSFLDSIRDEVA